MHLPSARTLQAFIAVARFGSLAAASPHVAMSVPSLSRRLAGLERELGVMLFERVPRGLVLTSAGTRYLGHAGAVLEQLQAAAAELKRDASVVRVTTIPAFATRWLLPRLPAFSATHSGIEVDVRTSIAFERLDAGHYDFAVRLALDCEMKSAPLLPIHLMPVWSAAHPRAIGEPCDVLHHPLLGPDHRPEFWQEWLCGVGLDDRAPRLRDVDALLLYDRAASGAGVAIGIEPLVSALLHDGRFEGLGKYRLRSARSFFLVEPAQTRTRAARLFREWLHAEAKAAAD